MIGQYDFSLVTASFVVAVLASYSALYFGAQLADLERGKARRWLAVGALSMGTGVWVMHFVGMQAYRMPIEVSYDLAITLLSWLAAVGASGLALHMIGKKTVGILQLGIGSLFMAGGITSMHYVGMAAMQIQPGVGYQPLLFALSVAIAFGASAVALFICRRLRAVEGLKGMAFQFLAALVMGVAICGMHYTGMAAMMLPENAAPVTGNLLSGNWLGTPLAMVSGALIFVALVVSASDVKHRRIAELHAREESERIEIKALYDTTTGLPNRASLANHMVTELARGESSRNSFAVIYLDVANYRDIPTDRVDNTMASIAGAIAKAIGHGHYLARYSASSFVAIVHDPAHRKHISSYQNLRDLPSKTGENGVEIAWRVGQSMFPASGRNSRMLIRKAMVTQELQKLEQVSADDEALRFEARSALPEA